MYRSRNIHHIDADIDQYAVVQPSYAYKEELDALTWCLIVGLEPSKD